jgi:hypothetical protein
VSLGTQEEATLSSLCREFSATGRAAPEPLPFAIDEVQVIAMLWSLLCVTLAMKLQPPPPPLMMAMSMMFTCELYTPQQFNMLRRGLPTASKMHCVTSHARRSSARGSQRLSR